MPDLTAANITVTITPGYDLDTSPDGRIGKRAYATLAFGDAALTYPTNGIPMPAPGAFGMNLLVPYRWVDIRQPAANAIWTYDATVRSGAPYGTLRAIIPTTGNEMTGAVAATSLAVEVTGK